MSGLTQRLARIQHELAGEREWLSWPGIEGKPLTPEEMLALRASCEGLNYEETCKRIHVHVNTLKYRLARVRSKLGLPSQMRHEHLVLYAVTHGVVVTADAEDVLHEFMAHLATRLPAGPLTPLAVGLRQWLEGEMDRYLAERALPAREAA